MFIVFEGIDGVGKTTQIKRVKDVLEEHGLEVITTREPGGTKEGEFIRDMVFNNDELKWSEESEIMLFLTARLEHIRKVIVPNITEGKIVLCDRFNMSSLAYQCNDSTHYELIKNIYNIELFQIKPHLTIFLDINPEKALERLQGAENKDNVANETLDRLIKIRENYYRHINNTVHQFLPISGIVRRVDANQTEENVTIAIMEAIGNFQHHIHNPNVEIIRHTLTELGYLDNDSQQEQ